MNSKKRTFFISQSIVVLFVLIVVLFLNYLLIYIFGFNQDNFIFITIPILFFGLIVYFFLSKPLLKPLFKSDENLQKTIKETLHELNIPSSTILANVQMLEKNIKDEKNIKRLNRIKLATNELLKLYNQMEYNIKKEIEKIEKQEFYLNELIDNSIEKFDDIKNTITISSRVQNIKLFSDKNGFEKVIDNLLSNALKYNCENGFVNISYEDKTLIIFNSGKEIDTKKIFLIFDEYYQEDSNKKGFGLGLNMVKEFCDKNSIEIKIDSSKKGTKFYLNLSNILRT